ncbi:5-hydroxytryptamine receptor 7-like [Oncorhynchus tshawytscha]|uniref:5-hydroxytryptamine receptor 7-like n=1 Tax=Oncorhynchus tshawytscha TaxID=74940 RepID=UPI001C3C3750|nr:5-hydroxytryptamine receptor 7-like [Oncorhynchus tshawytscha]
MISEALVPHLLKIVQEAAEAVSPTSQSSTLLMENGTRCGEQILNYDKVEKVFIGAILTTLTLFTICGNLLVVISVCFVKKLRQPSNYLIVSLAVADLSIALAVMPYLGITKPLTYPMRQNGCCMAKMVLSVWLLSASITLPPLFGWAQNVNDNKVCLISQDFGYTIYSTSVAFYIPVSVMLIMYYRIYRAAKLSAAKHTITGFPRVGEEAARGEEEEAMEEQEEEEDSVDCVSAALRLHREVEECTRFSRLVRSNRRNMSIFKREQKAAGTLGIVVGAFSVCWMPFFLLSTARPFICRADCPSCVPLWVERTLLWLGYANSLLNPFIYAFFNRDLRTTYSNLLRCRYRNINRKLSAVGMQQALKLVEKTHSVI